jgi:hypothetical protein
MGRFTTPDLDNDSALDSHDDPQSWNGYAYARNNPLLYADLDGRDYAICVFDEFGSATCFMVPSLSQLQSIIKNSPGFSRKDGAIYEEGVGQVGVYGAIPPW